MTTKILCDNCKREWDCPDWMIENAGHKELLCPDCYRELKSGDIDTIESIDT